MKFLHYDFTLLPEEAVIVTLDTQANVRLLDDINFSKYKQGTEYNYYGGQAVSSPVILKPPHPGHWHLVIDTVGYVVGTVQASVRVETVNSNSL